MGPLNSGSTQRGRCFLRSTMAKAVKVSTDGIESLSTAMKAAERLFGERGFRKTTLEDVAAAAHVSRPLVYRYFGDTRRSIKPLGTFEHSYRSPGAQLDAEVGQRSAPIHTPPSRTFPPADPCRLSVRGFAAAWFASAHPSGREVRFQVGARVAYSESGKMRPAMETAGRRAARG